MKKYILALIVAAAVTSAFGQNKITWQKKSGPYGGSVADLVVHSSGTVYALGDNPNQVIWKSTDNGNTWVEHTPAVFGQDAHRIQDIKLGTGGTIYALGSSNIYKTTDNGTTWTKLNSATGSDNGGFDAGEEIGINVLSGTLYIMGYNYPDSKYTVFRSVNGGTTWTKGYQNGFFGQFASNTLGEVYAVSGGTQVWKSTDDGVTFTQLVSPVPSDVITSTYSLVGKPNGSEIAVVTGSSAMYTLSGTFTTWTAVTETGIEEPANYAFNSPKIAYTGDNSTLLLFDHTNNKVYSKASAASSWTKRTTSTFLTSTGEDIQCFASADATTFYVGTQRLGVYKSINTGAGWTEVNTGIENLGMRNMVVADNGAIIAAGSLVFRSTDDGQSWSKVATACCQYYTVIKASTGTPKTLLLLAEGGGVSYKSTDNGANWSPITNTPGVDNFVSPDGTKLLGFSYNQIYYSANQGTTWTASAIPITGLPASYNFTAYHNRGMAMDQNGIIYAYVYSSGTRKFFKITLNNTSTPTSATATEISFATMGMSNYVNGVKFLNNKIYVNGDPISGSGSVVTSTANAGSSWSAKTAPSAFQFDVDPINNYLFVLKSSNGSYTMNISRDDGTTYTDSDIAISSSHTYPYGVAVNSSGVAFAGFNGTSVYKSATTIVTPAAPTGLVSVGRSANRLTLQWNDNATNENRYLIEVFNGTEYDSLNRTSSFWQTGGKGYIELQNLTPNTTYQFQVSAKNDAGPSSGATITTSTLQACVSDIPDNRSWTGNVSGTALTNVLIRKISDGVYSISDVNNGRYVDQTTVPATIEIGCSGSTPQVYLRADYPVYANSNGTWNSGTSTITLNWITEPGISPTVTGAVTLVKNANDPAPAAPNPVTAYIYSDNSIEVKWVPSGFEKKFYVERKTGVGGTYAQIAVVDYPATSFMDQTGLAFNNTYFYRVKSENANAVPQQSAYSTEAQILFKKPNFVVGQTLVNSTPYNSLGAVWSDFNNDGFDDLLLTKFEFFTGTQTAPIIFQNTGAGNFTLATSNLDALTYANGTAADYDNDGDIDLFYSTFGETNRLYNGDGSFNFARLTPTAVENQAGTDFEEGPPFSVSWVDYNNDGLLDLFIARNGNVPSQLFKQNPDHTFTLQTSAGDLVTNVVNAFASAWADFDNDGDKDVFMIDQRSSEADKLFRNNGDGTFTKLTGLAFDSDLLTDSQAASWADFDNDQDMDLFIGAENGANVLYKNNGNSTFTKQTSGALNVSTTSSLGSNWVDVNNDGYIDLIVLGQLGGTTLFLNSSGTSFTKVNTEKISDATFFNLSAASTDFNNDGFMDIFLTATAFQGEGEQGPPQNALLMKNNNTTGNWLKIKLVGTASNRSAIGAKLKITTGALNQIREVTSHIGIASQNSLTQHFGLGTATKADNVTVYWPSGLVQTLTNVNANTSITIIEDSQGPAISSRTPDVSSTDIAANTTISFTLNEASTAQSGKMLLVYRNSDLTSPFLGIAVTAAVKSGNTYTFTLSEKLLAGTKYNVSVDAGAFKDAYGNASLEFPTGSWSFTIAPPPVKTVLSPAHDATNVAINSPLQITFDKNVTAVAGKRLKVMDGATALVDVDVSASGTVSNNIYSITPPSTFPNDKLLKVVVDAGAFLDATKQTEFAGIAADTWNFRTVLPPDVTPPVMTFSPPQTAAKGFNSINSPEITVTDDRGTVSSVVISIKKLTAASSTFVEVPASQGTGANANKWVFTISESNHFDAIGTEYFITAKDAANNAVRSPANPNTTHKLYLTYTANESKIPSDKLGFGGALSNWKVFSIPFDLGVNNSFTTIFNELDGKENKVDYRFLTILPTANTNWTEYPSFTTITRGQGYFSNIKSPVDILLGAQQAPENSRTNLFTINLKAGWNMIGNPYLTQISWANVKDFNALTGQVAELHKFNGSSYPVAVQTLDPYEGGFVFAQADRTVTIPFLGQTASGGRLRYETLSDDINNTEWLLKLNVKQGEVINDLGSIGMAPDAKPSLDDYDGVSPPRFITFLETNFAHPEHFAKKFTRDVVPTQASYTWELSVDTNLEGMVEIFWNNSAFASGTKEIVLFDVARQVVVDMRKVGSYAFDPKESVNFKVYFGENLKIAPEAVQLGKAFPNPTSGNTNIAFSLPDSGGQNQFVTLEILDAMGRTMATIANGRYQPGFYEATVDAKELTNGFYTYRLTVQNAKGRNTLLNKLIIK